MLHEILKVINILHCLIFFICFHNSPIVEQGKRDDYVILFLCSLLRQSPFSLINSMKP